jgi:hypothetical protein
MLVSARMYVKKPTGKGEIIMPSPLQTVYQFKVTLKGIRPPVWRRIQVPQNYTFWDLHVAIQDAMGWLDSHLHAFHLKNPKTEKKDEIGIPTDDFGWSGNRVHPGWERRISRYFSMENAKALYLYDFGDDWQHEVKLEKILPREKGIDYPLCVKGKRACPPEDCGGVFGYLNILEILSNPEHEEYEETMEWLGEGFDPEYFDPEEIEFWDPRQRWDMAFGDEEDLDDDEDLMVEGEEDDLSDEELKWLSRDYFHDIWQMAQKGDLDDLIPEERRLAQIMLDHRDDLFKDFAVADDYPDQDVDDENETNPFLHVTIHSIVEDQLAEKDPIEVVQFYKAMRKKQCTHHDTVHLIAAIFVPLMFGSMTEQESFDIGTYRKLLNKYKTRNPEMIMDLLEKEKSLFPDEA